jgi:hypothetical protein
MDLDQEPGVKFNWRLNTTDPVKKFVCLQLFDFDNLSLDEALRLFLSRFCLVGETQVPTYFNILNQIIYTRYNIYVLFVFFYTSQMMHLVPVHTSIYFDSDRSLTDDSIIFYYGTCR